MKLSLSLFVITLALSATTTAYGAEDLPGGEGDGPSGDGPEGADGPDGDGPGGEAVTGATNTNGVLCGAQDSGCTGEYDVPDDAIENICPDDPSGECGGELEGVTCQVGVTRWKCTNGMFKSTTDGVGAAFTDPPTAAPIQGTAGPAVFIYKDADETDVSGIDIGIDDSAAASTAIVSSIVGITAAVGVVALL